ncbi:hypothetical protein BLOT_007877 [Blomia tropicalis]|nr:hypothetical protein BLOT_007877 [Blomia tropicalis]
MHRFHPQLINKKKNEKEKEQDSYCTQKQSPTAVLRNFHESTSFNMKPMNQLGSPHSLFYSLFQERKREIKKE